MIIVKPKNNKTHVWEDMTEPQQIRMGNASEIINFVVLLKGHELPCKLRYQKY